MIKRKNVELAVLFALIFSVLMSVADFDTKCSDLKNNILRLHIIANSDSEKDQELKLMVRDAVLNATSDDFSKCQKLDDAVLTAQNITEKIKKTAEDTVKQNGFSYKCRVSVKKEYFGIREYDDFTLPAGEYKSLVIRIGEAKGHNWWCVIFPGVCLPAADVKPSLEKSTGKRASDMAYNGEKYIIRFKTAEIYEKIKENFKKINKMINFSCIFKMYVVKS